MEHQCLICGKTYTLKKDLQRHNDSIHGNNMFTCLKCNKRVNRKDKYSEHGNCKYCDLSFETKSDCDLHVTSRHSGKNISVSKKGSTSSQPGPNSASNPNGPSTQSPKPGPSSNSLQPEPSSRLEDRSFRCGRCNASFTDRRQLYLHDMREHYQTGTGAIQSRPCQNDQATWEVDDDDDLKKVYESNAPLILENHQESSVSSTFNVPLTNDFSVPQLMEQAQQIYDRQGHAFRLNLEFGVILHVLRNTETGDYRYFRAYANESLFKRPVYISRRRDLNRLRLRLERFSVTNFILRQRPDTKWKPYLITNVRFVIYHLNYPLGYIGNQLPEYITASKSIIALNKSRKGIAYKYHLCAFRCLAVHRGHQRIDLEAHTTHLYGEWIQFAPDKHLDVEADAKKFKGLPLH
ncbi:unnamed protein product [Mytilus coruscus]|uniref:C2H2-type domain-containing protein n=1 Tax=Mytilus coruscus TaxID=42192 RepID=A0A6J8CBF8_MYTCO|nr:unnamed protein product [Mytilus coruscus]